MEEEVSNISNSCRVNPLLKSYEDLINDKALLEAAKSVAIMPIDSSLIESLSASLQNVLSLYTQVSIFATPVDYIGGNLPDYTDVIRKPMDITTLRNNLVYGEYIYLFEFLHDSSLIWKNCRQYNLKLEDYVKLADDMESKFVLEILKIPALKKKMDRKIYDIIVSPRFDVLLQTEIPKVFSNPLNYSASDLHVLYKKLQMLPEPKATDCICWYMAKKNNVKQWQPAKIGEKKDEITGQIIPLYETLEIKFNGTQDAQLLCEWEDYIEKKLIEQDNKPLPERKKRGPVPGSTQSKANKLK